MLFYPVVDRLDTKTINKLGYERKDHIRLKPFIKAIYTNENRCPKAGEWFLSGAEPEAYLAKKDLESKYPIAKIVLVKEKITYEIISST